MAGYLINGFGDVESLCLVFPLQWASLSLSFFSPSLDFLYVLEREQGCAHRLGEGQREKGVSSRLWAEPGA